MSSHTGASFAWSSQPHALYTSAVRTHRVVLNHGELTGTCGTTTGKRLPVIAWINLKLISGSSRKVGFTHKLSISELLHFFHCLHVQEKYFIDI